MKGDRLLIDKISNEPIHYELILCKPNEEQICSLKEIKNLQHEARFPTTDELTFEVPYYVLKHGQQFKNPIYDLIKGDYLILVNRKQGDVELSSQYFIISTPKDSMNNEGDVKFIHAYSREYELNKKIIRDYSFVSRKLYSHTNEMDEDGEHLGIMNFITTLTSWSLDLPSFQDLALDNKYRSFDVSELTLLAFLTDEIQRSFNIVFLFDTVNKKISAKRLDDLKFTRGLYISNQNYLKSIIKEPKHGEIVTRLYCYGKDDISIETLNPTGTPYIELFDFYKNTYYMSQELIDALDAYDELLEYHKNNNTFENLLDELNDLYEQRIQLMVELDALVYELDQIQDQIDLKIKLQQPYDEFNTLLNQKELEILNKQAEIDHEIVDKNIWRKHPLFNPSQIISNKQKVENKLQEISDFNNLISKKNNFTLEQITELDFFIREKVWMDTSYETEEELYEEGKDRLYKLAQPPVQFDIDVVDFLSIVEGKADRHKLRLGDIVYIQYDNFGIDIEVRLVSYTYNPSKNELKMTFSNTGSIDDPYLLMVELNKQAITTSTTVNMDKFKWDKSEENQSLIRQIIDRDLEAHKNKVLAGKDQNVVIDGRGIWISEVLPDGSLHPDQMRIVNGTLVISDDSFNSAKLAISGSGIVGQTIIGKLIMGEKLIIGDEEGTFLVQGNLLTIKDRNDLKRVLLGEFDSNKFGIKILNEDGSAVILDNEGMMQTWQDGRTDNVDTNNPLIINVYIPKNTRSIYESNLSFKLLPFRSYSKGLTHEGDTIVSSTSSGGGSTTVNSTSSGGGGTTTTSGDSGIDVKYDMAQTEEAAGHKHMYRTVIGHKHAIEIPDHTHDFVVNIPNHTHNFSVNIPPHTHDIQHGIYTSTSATGVGVIINNVDRTSNLGGKFYSDKADLNITDFLDTGWNEIKLTSERLGRIDANIFIQAFLTM